MSFVKITVWNIHFNHNFYQKKTILFHQIVQFAKCIYIECCKETVRQFTRFWSRALVFMLLSFKIRFRRWVQKMETLPLALQWNNCEQGTLLATKLGTLCFTPLAVVLLMYQQREQFILFFMFAKHVVSCNVEPFDSLMYFIFLNV